MVGKNAARQGRSRRSKPYKTSENIKNFEIAKAMDTVTSKGSNTPSTAEVRNSTRNKIYATENKHINLNDNEENEESNYDESSVCSQSQRGSSSTRKERVANDPMWRYYPKQVQNVLKKKRIDRDRLKRSLKTPGKRNYKTLFSNLTTVCAHEVSKATFMFKDMKDTYYKLTNAEKKVQRALREKGLYLDRHDFNIMEVFNSGGSYYESEDEENSVGPNKHNYDNIYVEELRSTSAKLKGSKRQDSSEQEKLSELDNHMIAQKDKEPISISLPSISPAGTPNSQLFDKVSHISKDTHRSNHMFASRHSNRMLFQEYQTEKRPTADKPRNPPKDFL